MGESIKNPEQIGNQEPSLPELAKEILQNVVEADFLVKEFEYCHSCSAVDDHYEKNSIAQDYITVV